MIQFADWQRHHYAVAIGALLIIVGGLTALYGMTASDAARREHAVSVRQQIIESLQRVDKPTKDIPSGVPVYLEGPLSNWRAKPEPELLDSELGVKISPGNRRLHGHAPSPEPTLVLRYIRKYNGQKWVHASEKSMEFTPFPLYLWGVSMPWSDQHRQYSRGPLETVELTESAFLKSHPGWSRTLKNSRYGNFGKEVVFRQHKGKQTPGDFFVAYHEGAEEPFGALGEVRDGELVHYHAPSPFDTLHSKPVSILAMVNQVAASRLKGLVMGATFEPVPTLEGYLKLPIEGGESEQKVGFHTAYSLAPLMILLGFMLLGRGLLQRRKLLTAPDTPSL